MSGEGLVDDLGELLVEPLHRVDAGSGEADQQPSPVLRIALPPEVPEVLAAADQAPRALGRGAERDSCGSSNRSVMAVTVIVTGRGSTLNRLVLRPTTSARANVCPVGREAWRRARAQALLPQRWTVTHIAGQ